MVPAPAPCALALASNGMPIMAASRYFILVNASSSRRACHISRMGARHLPLPHAPDALSAITCAHRSFGFAPSALSPEAYRQLELGGNERGLGSYDDGVGSYVVELALASVRFARSGPEPMFAGYLSCALSVTAVDPSLMADLWSNDPGQSEDSIRALILALTERSGLQSALPPAAAPRKPAL